MLSGMQMSGNRAAPPDPWPVVANECDRLRVLLEVSEATALHRDIAALLQDLAQRLRRSHGAVGVHA